MSLDFHIDSSIDLLTRLHALGLLEGSSPWWWDGALSVSVVIGAILTQNTKWEHVALSLANLTRAHILTNDNDESLYNLAQLASIESYITPSGLYRQKSSRILALARAIYEEFRDFASFQHGVSREWLLERKGIGKESADAVLNYACGREIMVVDAYSARLLARLGREMEQYEDIQAWLMDMPYNKLACLYPMLDDVHSPMPLAQVYARYHGKIVEFSKRKLPLQRLQESFLCAHDGQ